MRMNIFRVMTDPRGFIKSIAKDKMGRMPLYLAWVIGMVYLLRESQTLQLSQSFAYGYIVLGCAILAIPVGYLLIYIAAFFVYWAGKIFKGKASYKEVFSALSFSRTPEIFVIFSWVVLTAILGQATFSQTGLYVDLPQVIMVILAAQFFFYVWGFVISLHTIGEVQGYSAWMALWNIILAFVIVFFINVVIEFIAALVFSVNNSNVSFLSNIVSLINN